MDEPKPMKNMTIDTCAACEGIFACEDTESFIYNVGLAKYIQEEAEEHTSYLCVDCMKERLGDLFGVTFASVYEIKILEKILVYESDDDDENQNDPGREDLIP